MIIDKIKAIYIYTLWSRFLLNRVKNLLKIEAKIPIRKAYIGAVINRY